MKYILLLLLVTKLQAQTPTVAVSPKKFKIVDTIITLSTGSTIRIRTADTGIGQQPRYVTEIWSKKNSMPNAMQNHSFKQTYEGNNRVGFDLYKSNIDNMSVLKPDAKNAASLGIAQNSIQLGKVVKGYPIKITGVTPANKFKLIPPLTAEEKKKLESFNCK